MILVESLIGWFNDIQGNVSYDISLTFNQSSSNSSSELVLENATVLARESGEVFGNASISYGEDFTDPETGERVTNLYVTFTAGKSDNSESESDNYGITIGPFNSGTSEGTSRTLSGPVATYDMLIQVVYTADGYSLRYDKENSSYNNGTTNSSSYILKTTLNARKK